MMIEDLLPKYRDYIKHERQLAPQTIDNYMVDARRLAKFVNKPVGAITRNDLREYVRHMSKRGYKAATIRRTIHGLSTFWKWLLMEGLVQEVITLHIPLPRKNEVIHHWMSEHELREFSAAAGGEPLRERLAWRTLAFTGMRPGELLNLRVEQVKLDEQVIVIRNTKSKRDRVLLIAPALLADFRQIIGHRHEDEFVFGGVRKWRRHTMYKAFHEFLERAGMADRGYTPYVLRHTFGTLLAMKNVPGHVLKNLMGHKSITTTEIYLHAAPANLTDAMKQYVLTDS